jgi:quercetin dioxygenase-like cupin family protein
MSFKDKRGIIEDLLVNEDCSVTKITFKTGAIRGNHYHKKTLQVDICLRGELTCAQDDYRLLMTPGNVFVHRPGVKHAYQAMKPSTILSICIGKRKGENYESDTYRLVKEHEKLL